MLNVEKISELSDQILTLKRFVNVLEKDVCLVLKSPINNVELTSIGSTTTQEFSSAIKNIIETKIARLENQIKKEIYNETPIQSS